MIRVGKLDLVPRGNLGERLHHILDLAGEHVHAADDEHVVGASMQAINATMRASASAFARNDARDVARAIAHHGRSFAVNRGNHKLAPFAIRQNLTGSGVDDLGDEVIFRQVQARLLQAFNSHAGAHGLGQAVNVKHLVTQLVFQFLAEVVGHGLGAVDAELQREFLLGVKTHGKRSIGNVHGIRRRAAQDGGSHGTQDANLTLGIARGCRNSGTTCGNAAVMSAQAAREQTVAVTHLHDVVLVAFTQLNAARKAIAPELQVVISVSAHRSNARGARRHMDFLHVRKRHRQHAVRICVAQVLLLNEGGLLQIG